MVIVSIRSIVAINQGHVRCFIRAAVMRVNFRWRLICWFLSVDGIRPCLEIEGYPSCQTWFRTIMRVSS